MKMKHIGIIGIAGVVALICAPLDIPARAHGSGFGMRSFHPFHVGRRFRHAHHQRNLNQWQWYGGVYAVPPYENSDTQAQPTSFVYVVEPPRVRSCQYVRETVTVPAESGGTRDITVTRC